MAMSGTQNEAKEMSLLEAGGVCVEQKVIDSIAAPPKTLAQLTWVWSVHVCDPGCVMCDASGTKSVAQITHASHVCL